MTLNKITSDGSVIAVATFTLNSTTAAVTGTIDMSSGIVDTHTLEASDVLVVDRVYVAGGGPSMTGSTVIFQVE